MAAAREVPAWAAALADGAAVLVFAMVGRVSHAEGAPLLGVLATASPFLTGAAAGWVLVRLRSHRWPVQVGTGIPVVVCGVVLGMVLRAATGQGTAPSFVLVATVVLAVLLLGWRAVAEALLRRRGAGGE